MGKREDAKNLNKQRIIQVARAMMQAPGKGFSMRDLADSAGVSVATPYNLFGSKQDIIAAVLDDDLDDLMHRMMSLQGTSLDVFFDMVAIVGDMFNSSPDFYRAGAHAVKQNLLAELDEKFRAPRHDVLRALVQQAVQEGYLDHRVNVDGFALILSQQFLIWIESWADGIVNADDMVRYVQYGFAIILAGVARDEHREMMQQRVLDYQSKLKSNWNGVLANSETKAGDKNSA